MDRIDDGYKLVVRIYTKDSVYQTPKSFYNLNPILQFPDSVKLEVIKELLKLKGDTSRCCRTTRMHYYEGLELTCKRKPKTQYYNMQIDALYMINKISHPEGVSMYSCFPVVVNWKTKEEINDRTDLIMDYYKIYEKCLQKALQGEPLEKAFQFNTTKYAWIGAFPDTIVDE